MNFLFCTYVGSDVDYASGPYTITFGVQVTNVSLNISIINDEILEGDETFYLTIDPSSLHNYTNVGVGSLFQATVIIAEDDCKTMNTHCHIHMNYMTRPVKINHLCVNYIMLYFG